MYVSQNGNESLHTSLCAFNQERYNRKIFSLFLKSLMQCMSYIDGAYGSYPQRTSITEVRVT